MEQLINFIIRPPRAEYNPKNDLLDQEFMLKGKWFQRKDLEVVNSRGDVLQCSHYLPIICPEGKALPCVIYCHGNSGCRSDASEAAIILLPSNITVFTLDFSGSGVSGGEYVSLGWYEYSIPPKTDILSSRSGVSGGEYVSLGWYEKDDLRAVVNYLREDGNVSLIGLWGRSMGAVTSLLYGAEDPSIAGMVLDSPFSDLVDLMMELVDTYKFRLPNFAVKMAIQYMRKSIQKKAKFDIVELNTIKVAKSCFVPVLIGHAIDDDFIQPHHSDRIHDAYMGDKNIIKFEGDHNSPRPQFYFDSINIFFHNVLQPPEDEVFGNYFDTSLDYFDKGLHDIRYEDDFLSAPIGSASSSTEDAINQLRSKRPMSRTEVPSDISSSTDKQLDTQEQGSRTEPVPSSSKMINFEFANGHPCGPHVPASVEDDEYVEYPLDNLAGFPSDVDEEERMFMEAVIESLKHLETRPTQVEEPLSSASTNSHESSQKGKKDDSLTSVPSRTDPSDSHDLVSQFATPDSDISSAELPLLLNFASSTAESSGSTGASAHSSDTSAGIGSLSDADIADRTKATVTVVKNPSSNIMDGLLRRWDLNFFKNR